jgi:hypothetical protein
VINIKVEDALERFLWPNGLGRDVWMLVDAARDKRIFGMLLDCFYTRRTSLFSGVLRPEIEIVAPYLIEIEYDDDKTRRFLRAAWGNNWGVFLNSDTKKEQLLRHLRSLLMVRDPKGRQLFFRYYDPRVLKVYLPTCTPDELETFFGPINRFQLEDESPETVVTMSVARRQLAVKKDSLFHPPSRPKTPPPDDVEQDAG